MLIIADSGSTKTTWSVFDQEKLIQEITTEGYNPYYSTLEYMVNSMRQNLGEQFLSNNITQICFYGAGCDGDKKLIVCEALRSLFAKAVIEVESDMMAASRSVLGNGSGLVCILGTGTNSCLVKNGEVVHQVNSLGFLLGDEGSGAYIGKKLLSLYARKTLPDEIMDAFFNAYQIKPDEVLNVFYGHALQNRYAAGFSLFVNEHLENPYMANIVREAFNDFFENIISNYPAYQTYPFNCIGSVGYIFKDILTAVANSFGMAVGKVIKSPMENLCNYHFQNLI